MRNMLRFLLMLGFVLSASAIVAAAPEKAPALLPILGVEAQGLENSYIITLKDVASIQNEGSIITDIEGLGATVKFNYSVINGFAAELPPEAVEALRQNPWVERIERDGWAYASVGSWGLDRIDQRDLPLNDTYNYDYTGEGVNAYIIDTGVRPSHQEFSGRYHHGYDFIDNDSDASDCHGHGTHVAGTVGGTTYGVAKNVEIWSVRVLDCNSSGQWSQIISGIDWVAENHQSPAVANMSLGGSANSSVDDAVKNLVASGVVTAVAGGNDNANACNYSPARVNEALTAGATESDDDRSSFSNYGTCLDIFGPGTSITSSSNQCDTCSTSMSGTSMASPHVTGVAALVRQAHPDYTAAQVFDAIINMGTANVVNNAGTGSPNLLLYGRESSSPSPTPTTAPPTATPTTPPPTATPTGIAPTATPQPGTCTVYSSTDVPVNLPNGAASIDSNLSVSGSGTIQDLNVSVDMSHAWVGDLIFTLSHDNTSVTIIDRPGAPASTYGCSIDDIQATLDDEAASAVENQCARSAPAISGAFQPNQALSAFDGLSGDGDWVLQVEDAYTSEDAGTLNAWSIEICTGSTLPTPTSVPPTPTPTSAPPTPTPTQQPGGTMHVGDLDGASTSGSWYWNATVTVTVHDVNHNPVAGAAVSGSWDFASWNSSSQCTTNSSGRCQVGNQYLFSNSTAFTVQSVSHASLSYQAGDNHDPDGDSNGATITVFKP